MSGLDSSDAARFWQKVEKTDGCWEWRGYYTPQGVPCYKFRRKNRTAYRWALAFADAKVPDGAWLRMRCGNARCVRPDHIEIITHESHFWANVAKSEGCWTWTGARHTFGYGKMTVGNKTIGAHVFSWQLHFGPVPAGQYVLHSCDNPPCCRPDHLFLGTATDNVNDMLAKGRNQHGIGHHRAKVTPEIVRDIRRRAAAGETHRAIGVSVGLTHGVVGRIVRRRLWKEVE